MRQMGSQKKKYGTIKEACLQKNILFEDTEFPATDASLYFSKVDRNIIWKRPHVCHFTILFDHILQFLNCRINSFSFSLFKLHVFGPKSLLAP